MSHFLPGMQPAVDQLSWFALHVNSRKVNWIAAHLLGQGYQCFLPKYKALRQWSDRKKEIELPLFPGYIFSRFDPLQRLPILKTPGVLQIVGYRRTPVPIDEQEIQAIQRMTASGLPRQPWPYLEIGDQVRVTAGALRGLEGILVSHKGNHRLVLSVSLLQRSVAVELDSSAVQSLRETSALTAYKSLASEQSHLQVATS